MPKYSNTGFPKNAEVKSELLVLIFQKGGSISTTDKSINWSVYEVMADCFNLPEWVRNRKSDSDPRPAWRAFVGYRRKDLVTDGFLYPSKGRDGIWTLTQKGIERAKCLPGI
jgi:hypothetical protein